MSKKDAKTVSRFPGITSLRTLSVLAKNSARGADDAFVSYNVLSKEVSALVQEIARLRTPSDADPETAKKLSDKRAALRDERDAKDRSAKLAYDRGVSLEGAYDEYSYLLKRLTGEEPKLRRVPRFNQEVKVNVSDEDLQALIEIFDSEEKEIAYKNSGLKPLEKAPVVTEEKKEANETKDQKTKPIFKNLYFILGIVALVVLVIALAVPKKPVAVESPATPAAPAAVETPVLAEPAKPAKTAAPVAPVVAEPVTVSSEQVVTETATPSKAVAEPVAEEVKPAVKEEKKVELKESDIISGDGFYAVVMPEGVAKEDIDLYLSAVANRFKGASYKIKNNTIVITYETKTSATEVSGNIGTPVEKTPQPEKNTEKETPAVQPEYPTEGEVDKKATRYPIEDEAPSKYSDYQREYIFPVWNNKNVRFGFGPIGWTGIEYYKDKTNEPYVYNSTYGLGLDFGYEHSFNESFGLSGGLSVFSYFVTFARPAVAQGLSQIDVVVVTDACIDVGANYHKFILDKLSIDAGVTAGLVVQSKDNGDNRVGFVSGVTAGLTFHYLEDWAFSWKMSGKLIVAPNYTEPTLSELNYVINPITLSMVYSY